MACESAPADSELVVAGCVDAVLCGAGVVISDGVGEPDRPASHAATNAPAKLKSPAAEAIIICFLLIFSFSCKPAVNPIL